MFHVYWGKFGDLKDNFTSMYTRKVCKKVRDREKDSRNCKMKNVECWAVLKMSLASAVIFCLGSTHLLWLEHLLLLLTPSHRPSSHLQFPFATSINYKVWTSINAEQENKKGAKTSRIQLAVASTKHMQHMEFLFTFIFLEEYPKNSFKKYKYRM